MAMAALGVPTPLEFQRKDFPHPFDRVPLARHHVACVNQRRRRSDVLCNTRRLLAEKGYSGVSLRDVAQRSNVSIQTVYNLVGNRTTLLAEAVVEHIGAHGRLAFTREGYPNPVIGLSDLYWEGAALYPQYTRSATLTYFPPERPLYEHIHRCGAVLLRAAFSEMGFEGKLCSSELQVLSSRIAALQSITVLNGLSGFCDLYDLRRELVSAVAQMLISVITPQHAAELTEWLKRFDPKMISQPPARA